MKQIRLFIVAACLLSLAAPAFAESPVHMFNRLRLGYDDNIYQEDDNSTDGTVSHNGDPDSSFRVIEEIELLANLNLQRTYLGLRYRPSVVWYADREDEDTDILQDLDLNFVQNFTPSLMLSISETLRASQLPELQDQNYIVRQDDDNLYNSALATLSYNVLPETRIDLSGRYITLLYTSDDYTDEGGNRISHDNDNYNSAVGGLTVRQKLAGRTTVMGDLRYQTLVYKDAEESNNRDSDSVFAGLGVEQTFNPKLVGSLRGGMESREYDNESVDDNTQPYGELSMTFLPSPATRITGAASYSISESDISTYLSQNRAYASLSLAHDFTAKLNFYLSGAYALSEYEADYSLDQENLQNADENSFLVSTRLSYRVSRINWLEIGYQFVQLGSDIENREDYNRNRFDVGWKVQLF